MGRTNIEIDDELIARVMRVYRLRTKREAVDLALRKLITKKTPLDMLDMQGTGWEGDLEQMRTSHIVELEE